MRTPCTVCAAALLLLSGCAALHQQEASDSEHLLKLAGFQIRPADNAERQQDLAQMPPRQIAARNQGGSTVYSFADPDNCRCLYVGGDKEYAELQKLRQARLDEHAEILARSESDRSIRSELWGPWNPEGLQAKGQP
jgi:hypothetical protein